MKTVIEKALNEYLEETKKSINTEGIDDIINLPAKYRFSVAKNLLTQAEFEIIKKTGVRKEAPKIWIESIHIAAQNAIRKMAYDVTDFGRYQSRHYGKNTFPGQANLRYEYGERYHRLYTSTDLYADYFFAVSEKSNFDFLVKLPSDDKPKKITFFDLKDHINHFQDSIKFDFIFNDSLFKRCGFSFDASALSVKWKDQEYHISERQVFNPSEQNKKNIVSILKAFQRRKEIAKKEAIFNKLPLDKIFVERQDSLDAGNCVTETDRFKNHSAISENANGFDYALRADILLIERNDNYAKRAVLKAYEKGHYIHT